MMLSMGLVVLGSVLCGFSQSMEQLTNMGRSSQWLWGLVLLVMGVAATFIRDQGVSTFKSRRATGWCSHVHPDFLSVSALTRCFWV